MKLCLVASLRCPACQGELDLHAYKAVGEEVIDGLLSCRCGAVYIVREGVPCMTPTTRLQPGYARAYHKRLQADAPALLNLDSSSGVPDFSFSWQWNAHAYDDLTWELRLEQRVELFYRYTDLSPQLARGLRVLDAGCGNGTLSAELAAQGMDVVAVDFSDGAMRAYQYQLFQSRVPQEACARLNYVQADLQRPPFPDDLFDLIYSDGVLHHTPDTKRTFMAISTKVRPGGRLFVWLYRRDSRPLRAAKMWLVKAVRIATGKMSYSSRLSLCYGSAFVLLTVLRLLHLCGYRVRPLIPIRQKAINLFDTIAPTYNHEHVPAETREWFIEAGYTDVREVTIADFRLGEGGFAMIGTRCDPDGLRGSAAG